MWSVLWLPPVGLLLAVVGCSKSKAAKNKTPEGTSSAEKTESKASAKRIRSRKKKKEMSAATVAREKKASTARMEEKAAILGLDKTQTSRSTQMQPTQKSTLTAVSRDDDTREGVESLQMVEPNLKSDPMERPCQMRSAREPTVVMNLKEDITVQSDPSVREVRAKDKKTVEEDGPRAGAKDLTRDMPTAEEKKAHGEKSPKKKNKGEQAKKPWSILRANRLIMDTLFCYEAF